MLKFLPVLAIALAFHSPAWAKQLTGAGATFVYPVMAKWADVYKREKGVAVNYQSIGSGGGIRQIQNKTVDFGASDMPLKPEDLAKDDLFQFPIVNGAVVPIVNVAGVAPGQMKFTGPLLADIFLGKIKTWNDPAIQELNPDLKLPAQAITVVRRSDGSGTTFIWTNYLSKVSGEWKEKVGDATAVNWPTGVGGKGNEGVASYVKQIRGSIGFVEFAYALQNKLAHGQVKNRAGIFVQPSEKSFAAAAAGAEWAKAKNYHLILTDTPGKDSWPIAGSTFILMHKKPANPAQSKAVIEFFRWVFANGAAMAEELHYVPIPASVVKLIEKTWQTELK
jgi:phosphate transport system substrate-binding protein